MKKWILKTSLYSCFISSIATSAGRNNPPSTAELVHRLHAQDSFELYAIPKKFNILSDEDIHFDQWKSHFLKDGQIVELTHSGTDHNTIHEYDTHIPLVFWGSQFIKQGRSEERVSLNQLAPTVAQIMELNWHKSADSPVLSKLLLHPKTQVPKVVLVIVIDQGGITTLQNTKKNWPNISRLMDEGFVFSQAFTDYGGAGTGASHAVIGTGTYPAENGIFENSPYFFSVDKMTDIYSAAQGVDMMQLKRPTLMDKFIATHHKNGLNLSYSSASRAALGMGGHGALYGQNEKAELFWFNYKEDRFESDAKIFHQPDTSVSLKFGEKEFQAGKNGIWEKQQCIGKKGKIFRKCMLGSPSFAEIEGDLLFETITKQREELKKPLSKALFMLSFKGLDYCGHYLGAESLECQETLTVIDRQIGRIIALTKEISENNMIAVITADHGAAPLPLFSGGTTVLDEKLVAELNAKFGQEDKNLLPVKAVLNGAIQLNVAELNNAGHKPADVAKYLRQYKVNNKLFFKQVLERSDFKK